MSAVFTPVLFVFATIDPNFAPLLLTSTAGVITLCDPSGFVVTIEPIFEGALVPEDPDCCVAELLEENIFFAP